MTAGHAWTEPKLCSPSSAKESYHSSHKSWFLHHQGSLLSPLNDKKLRTSRDCWGQTSTSMHTSSYNWMRGPPKHFHQQHNGTKITTIAGKRQQFHVDMKKTQEQVNSLQETRQFILARLPQASHETTPRPQ